jgi:hypothetical protein
MSFSKRKRLYEYRKVPTGHRNEISEGEKGPATRKKYFEHRISTSTSEFNFPTEY